MNQFVGIVLENNKVHLSVHDENQKEVWRGNVDANKNAVTTKINELIKQGPVSITLEEHTDTPWLEETLKKLPLEKLVIIDKNGLPKNA